MLLPADLLSSTLMPWAMMAPALPLIIMLFGRIPFTGLNVSILLICIVTMLNNMFYGILPKTPPTIRNDIHLAGIITEASLSLVLIWNLIVNGMIRKVIIAFASIMIGGLILELTFHSAFPDLNTLLFFCYLAIALLAGIVLFLLSNIDSDHFLTDIPAFWTGAGITFHFGLMALLLLVMPTLNMKEWALYPGFSLLFVISNCIRQTAIAIAVFIGRTRSISQNGSQLMN
jgi:hypothetical protein